MSHSLRNLFHAKKMRREESEIIRVLVSLSVSPDGSCLASLKDTGLTVTSVVGDKLIGKIASKQLPTLERHPDVVHVECSVILKPTDDQA